MANDLIPASATAWIPPEAKSMSVVVKYGIMAALAVGGLYAFLTVASPLLLALTFINMMLADGIHMVISAAGLLALLLVFRETFSSDGKINKLLRLPYWMFIRGMTRWFITIDPFAPIDQRIQQCEQDEELFDAQAAKISGVVSRLKEQEESCRTKSAQAQKTGIAAHSRGMKDAEEANARAFGQYRDTADKLANMRGKLEPMLAEFQRIAGICKSTIDKLKLERNMLQIQWDAQQAIDGVVSSANRILGRSKTEVWNMAEQAEDIVNTKFGDELGHLEHLKLMTGPLLQSFDLDNATYNEDMLQAVRTTGAKLDQASNATPMPASLGYSPSLASPSNNSAILDGFLKS